MKKFEFTGRGFEYFKIWIVNILLTIITIGIYYPWAKVRSTIYLYGNTKLEERTFNYHATGKQLFLGYLMGVILLALYIISGAVNPILQYMVLAIFLLSLPWIILRSFKFTMSMTSFNNVNFSFDGKLSKMYLLYLLYPVVFYILLIAIIVVIVYINNIVVTIIAPILVLIGFIYGTSFITTKISTYIYNTINYGTSKFSADLKINDFLKIYTKIILLNILILIVVVGGYILVLFTSNGSVFANAMNAETGDALIQIVSILIPHFIFMYFLLLVVSMFLYAYAIVKIRDYIFSKLILDGVIYFDSSVKVGKLTSILFTNLLMMVFTLGLAYPWAKIRIIRYFVENTALSSSIDLNIFLNDKLTKESAIGEEIGDAFDIDVGIAL
jgi:uncharacterized membrane protein YjgN (DUF898 family)